MAGINNFVGFIQNFTRGTTKDFIIKISQNGEPVDITGSKFYVSFAYDQDPDTAPEFVIEIDPPTDPLNGGTSGKITAEQTASLKVGPVYYSVRWINSMGDPYIIDMGKINIMQSVSDQMS